MDDTRMTFAVRKALAEDADAVWRVAHDRSKKALLQKGASDDDLTRNGFLLYPLAAQSSEQANYRERIELSSHFWVATQNDELVAFCMAYTFGEMKSFSNLTANDVTLLDYFLGRWECQPECVYLAQAATLQSCMNRGAMKKILQRFLYDAAGAGAPAVIGEVSQRPMNAASSALVVKAGFRMVATRTKSDPTNGQDRLSGTFVQTLQAGLL
jgi:hypothetical protein